MNLAVEVNYPQSRAYPDALNTIVFPEDWDQALSTDILVDKEVGKVAMARPLPYTELWQTGPATGNYARFTISDYLSSISNPTYGIDTSLWTADHLKFQGDYYTVSKGAPNNPVYSNVTYGANQPFFIEFLAYNTGNQVFKQFSTGYTTVLGDTNGSIRLEYWTNGKFLIYYQGNYVKSFTVEKEPRTVNRSHEAQGTDDISLSTYTPESNAGTPKHANKYIALLLIPFANRGLLVYNSIGRGFLVHFDEFNYDEEDSSITPANSRFWWQIHSGQQKVQVAKCYFMPKPKFVAAKTTFLMAPKINQNLLLTTFNSYTGTHDRSLVDDKLKVFLVDPNHLDTTFKPNNIDYEARLKITYDGNGTQTPLITAAQGTFQPLEVKTSDELVDIIDHVQEYTFEVPDEFGPTTATVKCNKIFTLEEEIGGLGITNKPFRVVADHGNNTKVRLFAGRTRPADLSEGNNDTARIATIKAEDAVQALERYTFDDPFILSNFWLDDAFRFLLSLIGHFRTAIPNMYNPVTGKRIALLDSWMPDNSRQERTNFPDQHAFTYQVEVNDSALDTLKRLFKDFIPDGMMTFRPVISSEVNEHTQYDYRFWVCPKWDLPTTPIKRLFVKDKTLRAEIARGGHGNSGLHTFHSILTSYDISGTEIGANRVSVMGLDYKNNKPIIVIKNDYDSQDPTLRVADRPDNWVGEIWKGTYGSDRLNVQSQIEDACSMLLDRAVLKPYQAVFTAPRMLFDEDTQLPIWKGDCVEVVDRAIVRILSLKGGIQNANRDEGRFQGVWSGPTTYTAEILEFLNDTDGEDLRGHPN